MLSESGFDFWTGLPTLFAREHECFNVHVLVDADLAAQSELAKHAVFFQAVVFDLSHFWFFGAELHTAGRASGFAAAAMADIHAILFQRKYELRAFFDVERAKSFCSHLMGRHISKILPEIGQKLA